MWNGFLLFFSAFKENKYEKNVQENKILQYLYFNIFGNGNRDIISYTIQNVRVYFFNYIMNNITTQST